MKKVRSFIFLIMISFLIIGCQKSQTNSSSNNLTNANQSNNQSKVSNTNQEFDNVEIYVDKGSIYVSSGDAFSFDNDGNDKSYSINNNTLKINHDTNRKAFLILPADYTFTSLSIEVDEGNVYFDDQIDVEKFDLEIKQGETKIENILIHNSCDIDIDHGSAYISGDLGKNVEAECDEGSIKFEIENAETDYNYDMTISSGNIRLDDQVFKGKSYSDSINNQAEKNMELKCFKGEISVEFK